jgi:flagellar biosynthesis protein FliQ
LAIVIVDALLITQLEEKTNIKLPKRVPFVITLACLGIWFYNPKKAKRKYLSIILFYTKKY